MSFIKRMPLFIIILVCLGITYLISKGMIDNKESGKLNPETDIRISMKITSTTFEEGGLIPAKYTCDGENVNPPLLISEVPDSAKSLVLIVNDPDAPLGTWNHLLAWNIEPDTKVIEEEKLPEGVVVGKNDFGKNEYGGPCPPSGTHRYFFRLYALDTELDLNPITTGRKELDKAVEGHIIYQTSLMGKYSKK